MAAQHLSTWSRRTARGAGPGAKLRLKPIEKAQRIQCREKQGLTMRGNFVTIKLRNICKI